MKIYDFKRFIEYCAKKNYKFIVSMRVLVMLILILLMWQNHEVYAQQSIQEKKKTILIDPGHGGLDSGAVSENGLQEKEVVLDIARSIIAWNKSLLDSKYDIYLTRSIDTLISLNDRANLAKYLKPDIFISLHCNHIDNPKVKGVEVYTHNNNEPSLLYAVAVLRELNKKLGFNTRKAKQANFQVLRETEGHCPAILIELGYLSNSHESDYLNNKEKRKVLALAILMAI